MNLSLFIACVLAVLALICGSVHASMQIVGVRIEDQNYALDDSLIIQFKVNPNRMTTDELAKCEITVKGDTSNFYSPFSFLMSESYKDPKTGLHTVELSPTSSDNRHKSTHLPAHIVVESQCKQVRNSVQVPLKTEIFAESIRKLANEFQDEKFQINIAVLGQVGAGKSTLVNSMMTAVMNRPQNAAVVSGGDEHVTKDIKQFYVYMWDNVNKRKNLTQAVITDTVGINLDNYQDLCAVIKLLNGENPHIYEVEEIPKKIKIDEEKKEKLESDLENGPDFDEDERAASKIHQYNAELFDIKEKEGHENRKAELQAKIKKRKELLAKKAKAKDMQYEIYYYKVLASVETKKKEFEQQKEQLIKRILQLEKNIATMKEQFERAKEESEKNCVDLVRKPLTAGNYRNKIHSVIFVLSAQNSLQDHKLKESLKNVFKTVKNAGINPIICFSKHTGQPSNELYTEIKDEFNISKNDIYQIAANLDQDVKNFNVDRLAFEILLKAVDRGNQAVSNYIAEKANEGRTVKNEL